MPQNLDFFQIFCYIYAEYGVWRQDIFLSYTTVQEIPFHGGEHVKKKCRPLCETPRSNIFCGPDKYLQLQEYTITQEMFPVLEIDSYFILVREGKGVFIINGEEFSVEPGCVSWIQGSQVLTICPNFGEQLLIWVCAYDYQLLSYYTFNKISLNMEAETVSYTHLTLPTICSV